MKPTGEPDVYIPCDILIKAIGQDIESGHFEKAGIPVSRGKIVTLKSGAFENMPGVFGRRRLLQRPGFRHQSHRGGEGRCGEHR